MAGVGSGPSLGSWEEGRGRRINGRGATLSLGLEGAHVHEWISAEDRVTVLGVCHYCAYQYWWMRSRSAISVRRTTFV